jgi:hypothetical protein
MITKLKKSIKLRLLTEISPHNPVKFLKKLDIDDYLPAVISTVYLYTRMKRGDNKTIYLTEVVCAIGRTIRTKYKMKQDSALAAKTGAFLLYSFEELKILQVVLGRSSNGNNSYIIKIDDDDALSQLWNTLSTKTLEKLPSLEPYPPYTAVRHPTGLSIVKTANDEVLKSLTPETHPMVFGVINKKMKVGWQINKEVFDLQSWALRNRTQAFSDIWDQQNPEARSTKMREARSIIDIASRFIDKIFYHAYYYDFRARIYPATAYLHEQGADQSRGLLLRKDSKTIGKEGFFWLLVVIASNWSGDAGREDKAKTDKIPLAERSFWTLDNEEIILDYATNPKINQGWMKADKPWQFLAACIELKKLREWQLTGLQYGFSIEKCLGDYEYVSNFEAYIDGSNNGDKKDCRCKSFLIR